MKKETNKIEKERSTVFIFEGKLQKMCLREIDSDYCLHESKGLCFVKVMLFGFDFIVSVF